MIGGEGGGRAAAESTQKFLFLCNAGSKGGRGNMSEVEERGLSVN